LEDADEDADEGAEEDAEEDAESLELDSLLGGGLVFLLEGPE
jgi:hypothetical protein